MDPAWYALPAVAAVGLGLSLVRGGQQFHAVRDDLRTPDSSEPAPASSSVVVINPSKFENEAEARARISEEFLAHGRAVPEFLTTTPEDPGAGMARQALESGAELVCACGGDGTVRAVGEALAGSSATMGLIPAGTANLLARNLDLPLDDLRAAVRVALTGQARAIDVGWLRADDGPEQAFLVIAGVGYDAEIMMNAPEPLKARVGPTAYVVSGVRHLNGSRERARIQLGDGQEFTRRIRSVLFANCGKLMANIDLIPEAEVDDGTLDVLVLSPKGVVGWAAVVGEVLTRHRRGHRIHEHFTEQSAQVTLANPLSCQLDGDPIGEVRQVAARVEPGALTIMVPPS
ncbi:MAG: diacylglycerol/lipid kinase family protein [Actinomycetales bacterium]